MEKNKSEIKLTVSLDEKNVPNNISWESSENEQGPREVSSMFLSLWDLKDKNTFNINLWTPQMTVEELNLHVFQTFMTMAESYNNATKDAALYHLMKDLGLAFGEKANVIDISKNGDSEKKQI